MKQIKKIALTNSNIIRKWISNIQFFPEKGLSSNINKTAIVYNRADMSRHRDTQLENPIKVEVPNSFKSRI